MKKLILLCFIIIGLQACQNEENYKVVRKEVLDSHDKIMMDGEIAIKNKMQLDHVLATMDSLYVSKSVTDTVSEKQTIIRLQAKLNMADEHMNDWMHNFNAELDGQSNEEAVKYFNSEKEKIKDLDSLYKEAISQSEAYLTKYKNL